MALAIKVEWSEEVSGWFVLLEVVLIHSLVPFGG